MNDRDFLLTHQLQRAELISRAREGKLLAFTMLTFPEYQVSWHHKLTCQYLNALIRGDIKRLMIFEPPRHGKSELTSRRLPALIHGLFPNDEILAASYNGELASDMTIDVQRIMDRPEYQEIFPNSRITGEGQLGKYARSKHEHELIPVQLPDKYWSFPRGSYRSAGVGGAFTGRGANWLLIDDPVKNQEDADSKTFRDNLWKWYVSSARTRLEKDGRVLITMTRWHQDDLAGRLEALAKADKDADQWTILKLPALKEEEGNVNDPRKIGEALWPEKYDVSEINKARAAGSRAFAAIYQQRPTAEGGNIIKAEWIKRYDVPPKNLDVRFDRIIQSWDFATKDKTRSDFAVGQVWGKCGANFYLLHQVRGRWSFPDACQKLIDVSLEWPKALKKVVEAKANGPAVIQTLKTQVPGLVESEPYGDKVSRLYAVSPLYEAGNVWYPSSAVAPWIDEHITELCDFPNGVNDDQVDAASQALDVLRKMGRGGGLVAGHGSGSVFKMEG